MLSPIPLSSAALNREPVDKRADQLLSAAILADRSANSLSIAAAHFDGAPFLDISCSTSLLRDQGP